MKNALLGAGVADGRADFLSFILGFLAQGYSAQVTDALQEVLGREPVFFAQ
jgi:hypothetical protein